MWTWILGATLWLSLADASVDVAGCPKRCICTQNSIVCRNVGFEKIPADLPSGDNKFTKIDLSQNYIRTVADGYFEALPSLEEILLDSNGISEINAKAFSHTNVKHLSLNNNQFSSLPFDALQRLKNSLEVLSLDRNNIETIDELNFAQFKALRHLNLANNLLAKVPPGAFKGLRRLETLKLGNNQIAEVSPLAFKPLPLLRELDISNNVIRGIPETIGDLPELTELLLSGNRIEQVPAGLLQHCPKLSVLNIQGNPLDTFDHDAFVNLPELEQLILSEARDVTDFPNLNGTSALDRIRIDRAQIKQVPPNLCQSVPNLRSLELKSNNIKELPVLKDCTQLRLIDFSHNQISDLAIKNGTVRPLGGLTLLHDVLLSHNNITEIRQDAFEGLGNLQILDLSNNDIATIHENAFVGLDKLEDLNLGVNSFSKFPTRGLRNVLHIKSHNNPQLEDFPSAAHFPKVRSLVLSYAYHCCQFLPSTYENVLPDYTGGVGLSGGGASGGQLQESVFFPGEGDFDHALWHANGSDIWSSSSASSNGSTKSPEELWANLGGGFSADFYDLIAVTPPPGIECTPAPGPFLPCNDLFDWWTLRCSVWIVFLLALLGNGCVVIVLAASRGKMDVPRFLVCNLAMADFFMGLYLGFLAVVDASTLGEFRKFALPWQFSAGCQAAGFFGVLSSELSVFTLAVITLERNYAITHAMHLNKRLSLKHASYIMMCGWSFALLMAALPLAGVSDYRKFAVCLPFETGDALSLTYVVFLMLVNGVAFAILMGCYLKMYCAIRGSQAWNSNDSRIAKRMALLVFTDFICWAPIAFLALSSCFGVHLISLEQAKVFTIFVLPLNSCCNPFLYAILTKQFKKDCVMICKAIEESRVTRGIGRCRHSSNFSNRQTPANTNSLNSGGGSGGGGSGGHSHHSRQTVCSCSQHRGGLGPLGLGVRRAAQWPFAKIKRIFGGYKDGGGVSGLGGDGGLGGGVGGPRGLAGQGGGPGGLKHLGGAGGGDASGSYAQQIAEIQNKQNRTKRQASLSSDNFSSSRSDSWRHHGACIPGLRFGGGGGGGGQRHRRRNSWTVTRKPSQDSQLSSSRNDSASSNSTNTWRMSRSSVSSDMSNSVGRAGSGYANKASGGAEGGSTSGKFSALAQRTQARAAAAASIVGIARPSPFARIASDNAHLLLAASAPPAHQSAANATASAAAPTTAGSGGGGGGGGGNGGLIKPKLIRQAAILADVDSTGSGKSVTFADPPPPTKTAVCPVHSAEYAAILGSRYRSLYNKLVESNQEDEESDMEASDADSDSDTCHSHQHHPLLVGHAPSLPLGSTYRTLAAAVQPHTLLAAAATAAPGAATRLPAAAAAAAPSLLPRKLSTISSKGSFGRDDDEEEDVNERTPLRESVINHDDVDDDEEDVSMILEGETVVEKSPPAENKAATAGQSTTRAVIEAEPAETSRLLASSSSSSSAPPSAPASMPAPPDSADGAKFAPTAGGALAIRVRQSETPAPSFPVVTKTVTDGKRRYLNTDV